jgi:division protein CdvB (Snf7/Vps24/ESCRT-III family)
MASMKLSLETAGEIATVKEDIAEIKHQIKNKMTVDHSEQLSIQNAVKSRVESIAPNYEMDKRKIYSQIHTHLRRAFVVPSYRDVKQKDFNESINWIKAWRPLI